MFNLKPFKVAMMTLVIGSTLSQAVNAQGITTLRDPLVPGAQETMPIVPPVDGPPPPPGCGPTPWPVTPGMGGSPGFEPWVPSVPSNSLGWSGTTGIGLPIAPPIALPPGVLGPSLTGVVPHEESTPGAAPPYIYVDGNNPTGLVAPEEVVNVNTGGGLPGTGGYNTTISKVRRGGQDTVQWEQRGLFSVLGGGGNSQDEVTETGPLAGLGVPFGVPTGFGYNKGPAGTNNDLRLSSIDLGGGMRTSIGGTKISTGSTLQDFGSSALRNNGIAGLTAHQSTEFGQGIRREPVNASQTHQFGCPFQQFRQADVNPQANPAVLGAPIAVETNF
jgi:hypothetical protein